MQAADIYDFKTGVLPMAIEWHDQRRRSNINDSVAWWPIPQTFRDQYLSPHRLLAASSGLSRPLTQAAKQTEICRNFLAGKCTFQNY